MKPFLRPALVTILCIVAAAAAAWWWSQNMEQVWRARLDVSEPARKNPMLATTLLLRQHHYQVSAADTPDELDLAALPAGTLLIADNAGLLTAAQAKQILAWTARGNTLIIRPGWMNKWEDASGKADKGVPDKEKAALQVETDPIGAHLGVRLTQASARVRRCDEPANTAPLGEDESNSAHDGADGNDGDDGDESDDAPPKGAAGKAPQAPVSFSVISCLTLPQSDYRLEIDSARTVLVSTGSHADPLWADALGQAVRVYGLAHGHIVTIAANYFDNRQLKRYDHAELLLALAALAAVPGNAHVTIVQHLSVTSWYRALWQNFRPALISLACLLVLLFWGALRRFGPLVPEPATERRALIEHIEASGRWLWKSARGRAMLLDAMREATNAVLRRRAPELQRLSEREQVSRLAQLCNLASSEVRAALLQQASRHPLEFTRQIRILSELRKHYDR